MLLMPTQLTNLATFSRKYSKGTQQYNQKALKSIDASLTSGSSFKELLRRSKCCKLVSWPMQLDKLTMALWERHSFCRCPSCPTASGKTLNLWKKASLT